MAAWGKGAFLPFHVRQCRCWCQVCLVGFRVSQKSCWVAKVNEVSSGWLWIDSSLSGGSLATLNWDWLDWRSAFFRHIARKFPIMPQFPQCLLNAGSLSWPLFCLRVMCSRNLCKDGCYNWSVDVVSFPVYNLIL